jgi:hypothetical protein
MMGAEWTELVKRSETVVVHEHRGATGYLFLRCLEAVNRVTDTGWRIIIVVVHHDAELAYRGVIRRLTEGAKTSKGLASG